MYFICGFKGLLWSLLVVSACWINIVEYQTGERQCPKVWGLFSTPIVSIVALHKLLCTSWSGTWIIWFGPDDPWGPFQPAILWFYDCSPVQLVGMEVCGPLYLYKASLAPYRSDAQKKASLAGEPGKKRKFACEAYPQNTQNTVF